MLEIVLVCCETNSSDHVEELEAAEAPVLLRVAPLFPVRLFRDVNLQVPSLAAIFNSALLPGRFPIFEIANVNSGSPTSS